MEQINSSRSYHLKPIETRLAQFARYADAQDHDRFERQSQLDGWQVEPYVLPVRQALFPQHWTTSIKSKKKQLPELDQRQRKQKQTLPLPRSRLNRSTHFRGKTQVSLHEIQKTNELTQCNTQATTEHMFGLMRERYRSQLINKPKQNLSKSKLKSHSHSKSIVEEVLPMLYASNRMYMPSKQIRSNPSKLDGVLSSVKQPLRRHMGAQIRQAIVKRIADYFNPQQHITIHL